MPQRKWWESWLAVLALLSMLGTVASNLAVSSYYFGKLTQTINDNIEQLHDHEVRLRALEHKR